jgi:hypothetical protein
MKRALLLGVAVVLALPAVADQPLTLGLRQQVKIQQTVLESDLDAYAHERQRLEAAYIRMQQQVDALLRAQNHGEELDSLRQRDEDLRQAESELMARVGAAQRLRQSILTSQSLITVSNEEIARLEGQYGATADPLSGPWRIVVEPGGLEGRLVLQLDGTLVQGTYALAGDWSGSMRGTYVARKIRLERIDSQVGFAAIYYGRLVRGGADGRIEGTWEATQLSSGLPSAGTWVAERIHEPEE